MERTLIDKRDLYILSLAEVLFENLSSPDSSIATAKNENFLCCHFCDPVISRF